MKYIPYKKLSKRKRREIDVSRRRTWGALSPITRKAPPPAAYDRAKAKKYAKKNCEEPEP